MPTPAGGGGGGEEPRCLRRVECAMRSMLYSLALRGSSMADLEVGLFASLPGVRLVTGTIPAVINWRCLDHTPY
jgi:hypothetical protein